ncbi:threonine/serine exporter family protein [Bacillus carboniphilus]|uniref:Threonine/serine exporter family protein n=1 Tax=Bacillus carboniphilus TaxID=86663 RepID=A0ABY9K387_9BACI|nr:threonine/serine exporter family protein [Bacillus carboniphilus]WLR44371.1 threonine/serine exporter family protein [Bacillus carboniphilus]
MFIQLVMSFIASSGFAILFHAPKESLIKCGFVGMCGWILYFVMTENQQDAVLATLLASSLVAIISQVFAKRYKTPVIIFSVSGIIPLVPGGLAYDAMRHFVQNDYSVANGLAAKVFMISGAIAIGLVLSEVLKQMGVKQEQTMKG